ncbi:MAG: hypothetical protein ED859_17430 [Desulfuromonadales bacterium]|nr:MAG: hypothetical protein ED859_17430 [Desulfuromonadales bacterium]
MNKFLRIYLMAMLMGLLAAVPAMAITIGFQPAAQTVGLGNSVSVDIVASLGSNEIVAAYDLDLSYDSTILSATNVTFGTMLGDPTIFEALTGR